MKTMDQLRDEIDTIDNMILNLLSERMKLVRKIAEQKKKTDLPVFDKKREEEVKKSWFSKAKSLEMENGPIQKILDEILKMSKELQRKLIK